MKIAPLCLVLALLSPAVAMRGKMNARRREQDKWTDEPTAAPLVDDMGDEGVDLLTTDVPEEAVGIASLPPKAPYEYFPIIAADGQAYQDAEMSEPWEMDNNGFMSSTGNRGSKSSKSSRKMSGDSDPDDLCTSFCQRYLSTCESANAFFDPATPRGNPNARRRLQEMQDVKERVLEAFAGSDSELASEVRRRLIQGGDFDIDRLDGPSVYSVRNECENYCMHYPRPINPATFLEVPPGGLQQAGDTFWCRDQQLRMAERADNNYAAQVFCPRASPGGGGFCANVLIDGSQNAQEASGVPTDILNLGLPDPPTPYPFNGTAYDFLRAGADTGRHLGYCRMYFDDFVADCTNSGIDDRSLPLALASIPDTAAVIILSNNVGKVDPASPFDPPQGDGITILPNRTFAALVQPTQVRALIIDDGNIATIEPLAFGALTNLEQISLNNQKFTSLSPIQFQSNLALRDVSIFNTKERPGQIGSLPEDLFRRQVFLQRVIISGHKGLTSLPRRLFDFEVGGSPVNVKFMAYLDISNNGLTNNGFDPFMMRDMIFLQGWDISGNSFQTIPKAWFDERNAVFEGAWPVATLQKLYMHNNPITFIEENALDSVTGLEVCTLHDTFLISVPVNLFDNMDNTLISYTISERDPDRR